MTSAFHSLLRRGLGAAIAVGLTLCLILTAFGNSVEAARSGMSGNYVNDTVSVAQKLEETIALPNDSENRSTAEDEALKLITDYISRYRNRSEVNGTVSFTTMQTALNSMAGHYKTFANRPLPDDLKDRLSKELTKAEMIVTREG